MNRSVLDGLLLAALVEGKTQQEAAEAAGCSRSTIKRRLADPAFRARLDELLDAQVLQVLSLLAQGGVEAAAELRALVKDGKAGVRLQAADRILDRLLKYRGEVNMTRRLDELEARLKSQGLT